MAQPLKGIIVVMLKISMIIYYYIALSRLKPRKRPCTRYLYAIYISLLRSTTVTVKYVKETAIEILVLRDILIIYSSFNRKAVKLHPKLTES
jgi:hypothetical protein